MDGVVVEEILLCYVLRNPIGGNGTCGMGLVSGEVVLLSIDGTAA